MQSRRNENVRRMHGFSFIELMAVLVLMSILVTMALPSYQSSVKRAKRAEAWTVMMKGMQQQERHYSVHGSYADFSAEKPQGFAWYSGSTPEGSAYEISAVPCEGQGLKECVMLIAVPGTARVRQGYADTACGTLRLDSAGRRSASSGGKGCW